MQYNLERLLSQKSFTPNNPAIITRSYTISASELFYQGSALASSIENIISENEYVGIYLDNSPEFIRAVISLWNLGAVPVPMNLLATKKELQLLLETSKIRTIITSENLEKKLSIFSKLSTVIVDAKLSETRNTIKTESNQFNFSAYDEAVVILTSGSTGKPKGVVHTFHSLMSSVNKGNEIFKHRKEDCWLASLPFYHIGGFQIIIRALYFGTGLIIPDSLQISDITAAITELKPTHASFVSNQLKKLLDNKVIPDNELRCSLIGGGFINRNLLVRAKQSGWHPVKVYGSSETASFVSALREEDIESKSNSVGKPLPDSDLIIVSEDGTDLPVWSEGEIAIRSHTLFKGYLYDKATTMERMKNEFYFTGDLGFFDNEGFLFVTGRKNRMLVTGGKNVNPFEVETAILIYPGIAEAAVFGIDDAEWGEKVCAAIVSTTEIGIDDLKEFLKLHLSPYKIPKEFYFEKHLPKTSLGKVETKKLQEKYSF